ncbi:hypothetical protein FOZ63_010259, partial [Perkinsus olseni]
GDLSKYLKQQFSTKLSYVKEGSVQFWAFSNNIITTYLRHVNKREGQFRQFSIGSTESTATEAVLIIQEQEAAIDPGFCSRSFFSEAQKPNRIFVPPAVVIRGRPSDVQRFRRDSSRLSLDGSKLRLPRASAAKGSPAPKVKAAADSPPPAKDPESLLAEKDEKLERAIKEIEAGK